MPAKSSTQKIPRFDRFSDYSVAIVEAILDGKIVHLRPKTVDEFCEKNRHIADQFGYFDPDNKNAKRNFRLNVYKHCENLKRFKRDGTGFPESFRSKVKNFPKYLREEDIPDEERKEIELVPGRDRHFEAAFSSDGSDYTGASSHSNSSSSSSKTKVPGLLPSESDDFSIISKSEVQDLVQDSSGDQFLSAQMSKLRVQTFKGRVVSPEVTAEVLDPVWCSVTVNDPDVQGYKINQPRECHALRINVPAGVIPSDIMIVSPGNGMIEVHARSDQCAYDAKFTLGRMAGNCQLVNAFQKVLSKKWHDEGGDTAPPKKYLIHTPKGKDLETVCRDPDQNWIRAGNKVNCVDMPSERFCVMYAYFFEQENRMKAPETFGHVTLDVNEGTYNMGKHARAAMRLQAMQEHHMKFVRATTQAGNPTYMPGTTGVYHYNTPPAGFTMPASFFPRAENMPAGTAGTSSIHSRARSHAGNFGVSNVPRERRSQPMTGFDEVGGDIARVRSSDSTSGGDMEGVVVTTVRDHNESDD